MLNVEKYVETLKLNLNKLQPQMCFLFHFPQLIGQPDKVSNVQKG